MVMTRVLAVRSGGCNTHVPQTEINLQFCRHGRSVFEIDEIDLGTGSRRRGTSGALTLRSAPQDAMATNSIATTRRVSQPGLAATFWSTCMSTPLRGSRLTIDLNCSRDLI